MSASAAHDWTMAGPWPNYTVTKNSAALLLQQIAKDVKPTDMQVVSFHPGLFYTELGQRMGFQEDTVPWDDSKWMPPGVSNF